MKKVTIYRPHTHAGTRYTPGPEGIEIEVDTAAAKFIKDVGADKPLDKAERKAAATPEIGIKTDG